MNLKELYQQYHDHLDALYGKEEVQSFFFLLLEHYMDVNRVTYHLDAFRDINTEVKLQFDKALKLLKEHKPIQYIVGQTEFFGLPFKVNPHTLIPRPETEELVSWIIDRHSKTKEIAIQILDIGTGSGCIAVALANVFKTNAEIFALDVSAEALKVAQRNADLNAVDVTFLEMDILQPDKFSDKPGVEFDIIVSNPPYVRELEKQAMQPNVLDHEPSSALFVNDDNPLQFYEAISDFAQKHLKDNGQIFFEINEYLGAEMIQLMKHFDFKDIELKQDMFGKNRMIVGTK